MHFAMRKRQVKLVEDCFVLALYLIFYSYFNGMHIADDSEILKVVDKYICNTLNPEYRKTIEEDCRITIVCNKYGFTLPHYE
jgi:hypothetical protein